MPNQVTNFFEYATLHARFIDARTMAEQISSAIESKKLFLTTSMSAMRRDEEKRELEKLGRCLALIECHLNNLQHYCAIEDLITECDKQGIQPDRRIIASGKTLAQAIDELNEFKGLPDPLQQLDRLYD